MQRRQAARSLFDIDTHTHAHIWHLQLRNCCRKWQSDKPGRLTATSHAIRSFGHGLSASCPRTAALYNIAWQRRTEIQARNFKWLLLAVNLNFTLVHISCP